MNHPRPYRPQSLQISADLIRGDTCDTWRFMNPLTGIWDEPATVPGYCYASPNGAVNVGSRATANYSLLTANWTFTFSAKERDTETGYSYFGSRYYNSDLSIWLSVDPMAHKYPSLSPYVYCANNPVRLVDPNGEEISVPDDPPKKTNNSTHQQQSSSMVDYYKEQRNKATTFVDKLSYTLKLGGEQLNLDEQSIIDAVTPFLETVASNMPIVSELNNGMIFFCGKDMYGNQADISDKGLVVICVITKGTAHNAKYILKESLEGGAQIVNSVGEWGTRLIQSIKTYRNQNQKQSQN